MPSSEKRFSVRDMAAVILFAALEEDCDVCHKNVEVVLQAARSSNSSQAGRALWAGGGNDDMILDAYEANADVYANGDGIWKAIVRLAGVAPQCGIITLKDCSTETVAPWGRIASRYPGLLAIAQEHIKAGC